ncbi:hypothetical protein ABZW03_18245 [Kitasatospora sp. NPDC004799]|uniref:hypothetical protein n=1 Tax=Kitasatospora sp. NPDC004799 TaxID=3154460 RepID=UPI0033AA77C1
MEDAMESVEITLRNPAEKRVLSLDGIAAVTWDREPGEVEVHGVLIGTRLWPMRHLVAAALGVDPARVGNSAGLRALDRLGLRTFNLTPYDEKGEAVRTPDAVRRADTSRRAARNR